MDSKVNVSSTSVLILGAYGLLGSTLSAFLKEKGYEIYLHGRGAHSHVQADLEDVKQVDSMMERICPDIVINLVALTDVDLCEEQPQQAYLKNVRIVEYIVSWIKKSHAGTYLIQISTDQVYDGIGPHRESDVNLSNYYAFSKYAGELVAMTIPSAVLRTNFFGFSQREGRVSISDWLYRSLLSGNNIQVFDDVMFSPLLLSTLSEMIERVALHKPHGIFNVGSREGLSKADFAFAFAREFQLDIGLMTRIQSKNATFLRTYRPKDMRMNSEKFETAIDVQLPSLREQINLMKSQYENRS